MQVYIQRVILFMFDTNTNSIFDQFSEDYCLTVLVYTQPGSAAVSPHITVNPQNNTTFCLLGDKLEVFNKNSHINIYIEQ